ncbi:hypothetical protein K502DRAFT_326684 [Neoconidiobolus thromboides FSU 785]|nr:hypothetical protein K502DRAFT_326684 [Neoconidiobolus thromboides FSU 785]
MLELEVYVLLTMNVEMLAINILQVHDGVLMEIVTGVFAAVVMIAKLQNGIFVYPYILQYYII